MGYGVISQETVELSLSQEEKVLRHLDAFKTAGKKLPSIVLSINPAVVLPCTSHFFNYILYSVKELSRCCVIGADVAMQPNPNAFQRDEHFHKSVIISKWSYLAE